MNKLKQEYIGLDTTIIESKNKSLIGVKGKIIDETKNTFKIKTEKGIKMVMKNISTFRIGNQDIEGEKIMKKSYDRIKLKGAK